MTKEEMLSRYFQKFDSKKYEEIQDKIATAMSKGETHILFGKSSCGNHKPEWSIDEKIIEQLEEDHFLVDYDCDGCDYDEVIVRW